MSTTTRLTFHEFEQLPEQEGVRYELDEGELLMEPSPTFRHNLIRDRLARLLFEFVKIQGIGTVTVEMDFRLGEATVRNPDIAYVTLEHLRTIELDRSPVDGAPALAVEVVSPSNLAQDMLKKVGQYLQAGTQLVWVVYPALRLVEIHTADGVRQIKEPASLTEEKLFGARFSITLQTLFNENPAV
jgi:Uma2 family endonuclease